MKRFALIFILLGIATTCAWSADVFCRFSTGNGASYGLLMGDTIHELQHAPWNGVETTGLTIPVKDAALLHPSEPTVIIGLSGSYQDAWTDADPFSTVRWFLKPPSAAGSPGDDIVLPDAVDAVKVETELVVIIGKTIKNATVEEAEKAIFGYTVGNDVVGDMDSYHTVAGEPPDQTETLLNTMLKTGDGFAIYGPFIHHGVDWNNRARRLTVKNADTGKDVLYEHTTAKLVYPPAKAVSDISKILTLHPGDVIFTGTTAAPVAVAGDVVRVTVDGLGEVVNKVVDAK